MHYHEISNFSSLENYQGVRLEVLNLDCTTRKIQFRSSESCPRSSENYCRIVDVYFLCVIIFFFFEMGEFDIQKVLLSLQDL